MYFYLLEVTVLLTVYVWKRQKINVLSLVINEELEQLDCEVGSINIIYGVAHKAHQTIAHKTRAVINK